MSNKTGEDIYGYAQDLLKFDGANISLSGAEESRALDWINDLEKQFLEEFYSRGLTAPDYFSDFTSFSTVSGTQLNGDVSAGATTFSIDSSSALSSSGAGVIYSNNSYNIFTFTGNSSGTVTGVPASGSGSILFDLDDESGVQKLYPLPSNFGRMKPGIDRGHGVTVNEVPYYEMPENPYGIGFSVFTSSSGAKYLWLPRETTSTVNVYFDVLPSLTSLTSELKTPSPYHWYHVYGLVGLIKQVFDEDYVPDKERKQQMNAIEPAFKKRTAGKVITGNNTFFRRQPRIINYFR